MTTAQRSEPITVSSPFLGTATGERPRLESIDLIRGLVMVFMALDHTKHNFLNENFNAMDPDVTTLGAYFTRWITHYCAPTFCFLMGTGAYLAGRRGKTTLELFWFLFSRGIWLLILEFTIVKLGMFFKYDMTEWAGVVYWSLGCCLIFLSLLVFLPPRVVGAIGVVMILTHNLFDGVKSDVFGPFRPIWVILHEGGAIQLTDNVKFVAAYPLVPWIGVVAAGYGFGTIYGIDPRRRRKITVMLGLALTIGFVVLRWINIYGDPFPWTPRATPLQTVMSFFNTHKYPPSLLFLMMTLGPALLGLAFVERFPPHDALGRVLRTFGRVPLFYWVLHWFVIGFLARGVALYRGNSHFQLPMVYFWVFVVLCILYLPCRWFEGVKTRNKDVWWLSYL